MTTTDKPGIAELMQAVASGTSYTRDFLALQDAAPAPASGWRSGIEASIRRLEAQARKPRDLWHAAYFAAIDEALVHLRAMLERGAERSVTPLDG